MVNIGIMSRMSIGELLVKSSSINADHNPGIGKQDIGLFKVLDIFKSVSYKLGNIAL